ncbi:metallophosphoesterase family protein [Gordonia sp. PDNC005]|uniref:metallophosphoesterase family protein n=1 Tax=unclassified Gordonia (in: high G+C Gram-positive bacteria) TaxID=2657482 RepID=UPI00196518A5|nr:metallophosphoesterase [Gordonia sp. PDNC005]QRY61879.1 metallophosphoesterase family protein [Gordonia sp. PDNC005]
MAPSRTFYTSDLHLGHQLVADLRGFTTTVDHDSWIVDMWAASVTDTDCVWILGDLTGGGPGKQLRALEILDSLPRRKFHILGNHDLAHPMHKRARTWTAKYNETFDYVGIAAQVQINNTAVMLSHSPYAPAEAASPRHTRHLQWRLPDVGAPLLHGHTHRETATHPDAPRQYDVGLDAHRSLVSEAVVANAVATMTR